MKTVLRYPLTLDSSQIFNIPEDFNLVFIGVDPESTTNSGMAMWAESRVGESGTSNSKSITVGVFSTGAAIPENWEHVGSVVVPPFVWHLYIQPY